MLNSTFDCLRNLATLVAAIASDFDFITSVITVLTAVFIPIRYVAVTGWVSTLVGLSHYDLLELVVSCCTFLARPRPESLAVNHSFGESGELLVGFLFLLQSLREQANSGG